VYQNYFSHVGMPFGGHTRGGPNGRVYVYRNICDQRAGVNWSRPSDKSPAGEIKANLPLVVHGRQFLGSASWFFCHNLFVGPANTHGYHQLIRRNSPTPSRWVLTNIFVCLDDSPHAARPATEPLASDIVLDGNLHWSVLPDATPKPGYLENLRTHERGSF